MRLKEEKEKDRLIPEIEKYKRLIMETELDILNNDKAIAKEQDKAVDLKDKINSLEKKKDIKREENEKQTAAYLKIKDEPVRIGKGNENLKIAVNHLKSELEGL